MARKTRIKFQDPQHGAYHIISRALQREMRFQEAEKQKFLSLLQWLSGVYFVRVATFSLMTNHIHLIIKMRAPEDISEEELKRRFDLYYNQFAMEGTERILTPGQIPHYYARFSDVSRFMQDLKQRFSRWYNQVHQGFGHVWAERFKSVLLVGPHALRACMLYVELNALRAGIVKEPEKYRYCGLYHYCLNRKVKSQSWLDLELLQEVLESYDRAMEGILPSPQTRGDVNLIDRYLTMVYCEGLNLRHGKASIREDIWRDKMTALPKQVQSSVYMTQIPQMTTGIILGSKEDCESQFESHRVHFRTEKDRSANPIVKYNPKKSKKPLDMHSNWYSLTTLFSIRSYSIPLEKRTEVLNKGSK